MTVHSVRDAHVGVIPIRLGLGALLLGAARARRAATGRRCSRS